MSRPLDFKERIFALPLLVVLALAINQAIGMGLSDIHFSRANTELSFWDRQNHQPAAARVGMVERNIASALVAWPRNPDYLDARARLLTWQAYWSEDTSTREALSGQAITSKLAALERRPARHQGWRELAGQLARSGQYDDANWQRAIERVNMLYMAVEP